MELKFQLNKPTNFVFDYLVDSEKFVSVHPVIFKMDKLEANNYLVYEKLKFAFIPVTFKYTATVIGDVNKKWVAVNASVMGIVKIEMKFNLNSNNNTTEVVEIVHFKSVLPVKFFMQQIFKKQHKLLFQNINNLNM